MSGHTPGPWKYGDCNNGNFRIYAPQGLNEQSGPVAEAMHRFVVAERVANARLIAASPAMLAALQEVSDYLDGLVDVIDGPEGEQLPNKAMSLKQEVDEAIARAEGKR